MRDVIFGLIWVFILPISLYSAHLGVLLWMWVALITPNEFLYSFLNGMPFNKLVAISCLLVVFLNKERKQFYTDPLIVLVALFSVSVILSYFNQEYPNFNADYIFDRYWKMILLAVLITGVMYSRHRLHQAAIVISLGWGFLMVKEALIFLLTAGGHHVEGTSSTGDNNGLALAILTTLPLLLYVAKYSAVPWVKLTMQITAGLGAVTVLATYSRGGFVALVVLGLMLMGGSKRKVQTFVVLSVFAIIVYQLLPPEFFARINTIKDAGEDDSFVIRLVAWKVNFLMGLDHPLLGAGPYGSLAWQNWTHYMPQAADFLFPTPLIWTTYVAHSIYFQVLGDTGVVGFGLFAAILLTAIFMARQTRRRARKDPALAWAADLARALETCLIVYCVAGAALSLVYFEQLFILLAMISRTHQTVVQAVSAKVAYAPARISAGFAPAYRRTAL